MPRLTDTDGIDAPFERAMRKAMAEDRECSHCGDTHGPRCPYLTTCQICERDVGDYVSTEADAKLADPARLCESCHADEVRYEKRKRAERVEDGRGDYAREMQRERGGV